MTNKQTKIFPPATSVWKKPGVATRVVLTTYSKLQGALNDTVEWAPVGHEWDYKQITLRTWDRWVKGACRVDAFPEVAPTGKIFGIVCPAHLAAVGAHRPVRTYDTYAAAKEALAEENEYCASGAVHTIELFDLPLARPRK